MGPIPEEFGKLHKLEELALFMNNLSGTIPLSISKLPALKLIYLNINNLSGQIPSGLWTMERILILTLNDNRFVSKLPLQLSPTLTWLDLSNNKFTGPVPAGIASLRDLALFQASNNLIYGNIPMELTALQKLSILQLDGNQLSEKLPSNIISWKSLTIMNLANNKLSGPFPLALTSLRNLNSLQLSNNHLSGQIPPELGQLKFTTLDLSGNNFSGKIPLQFDTVEFQSSFLKNPNLCSDGQTIGLPRCSAAAHKIFSTRNIIMTVVAGSIILLVLLCFLIRKISLPVKVKHTTEQPDYMMMFHSLNFTEADILNGLTETNVIGSGGSGKIYSIDINNLGSRVAVKRIWNSKKMSSDLVKQFTAEVEVLGRIRHANIVKLLCCVSTECTKLLVYEYLENKSLDMWLNRGKKWNEWSSTSSVNRDDHVNVVVLDWPTRLKNECIGAAKGLCYMHHDCSPSIVHRDVKSSNILLDSEFNAKIADFGLAKIAHTTGESYTASAIAGTFGYMAPDNWLTRRLNEKIDVYSFGVVLLELATGKEPCKGNDHLNLRDWSWQLFRDSYPIADVLDEDIKEPCNLEEMENQAKIRGQDHL